MNNMMKKIFQWLKSNPFALLSGVLIGTSYIPFPPWALLFCYAPLWLAVFSTEGNWKTAFKSAWLTQFVLSLIGFHWIAHTAKEFGRLPWPAAVLCLLLFAAFMHLYIPASVAFTKHLQNKLKLSTGTSLFVAALSLSLLERIWPVIFQWHLGYAWIASKIPFYQWADLIGFEGISTITLLFNAWFAWIWLQQSQTKKLLLHCLLAAILLAGLSISGSFRGQRWSQSDDVLTASLIQANIGNLEKVYAEQGRAYQESITRKFLRLSQDEVMKNPDTEVLVWPETAFPDYLGNLYLGRKHTSILVEGLNPLNKNLITGAYAKDDNSNGEGTSTYNALFAIKPTGEDWAPAYRKTHLLAFGEYLPFSEKFPILLKLLPFISNFGRGQGPTTMGVMHNSALLHFGGQICYESLYPAFSRGLAEKGAQILVNVTNDSWFGKTFEPRQHMFMTLARAVETRRPLIRSTNTGISTVILADGKILEHSPIGQEWTHTYKIPYLKNPPQSQFVAWGHWDWILWLVLLLGLLLKGYVNAKSRNA